MSAQGSTFWSPPLPRCSNCNAPTDSSSRWCRWCEWCLLTAGRNLVRNLRDAGAACLSHQLGLHACGCDQGAPSDAWHPNAAGRVPPQMCDHPSWTESASDTYPEFLQAEKKTLEAAISAAAGELERASFEHRLSQVIDEIALIATSTSDIALECDTCGTRRPVESR